MGSGSDASLETRTSVRHPASDPLSLEGPVEVVNVTGRLAAREEGVENHDGATVDDKTNGAREVTLEANGKVVYGVEKKVASEKNLVAVW